MLDTKESSEIKFDVTQVIVHPNYKSADGGFDIAIFKVDDSRANLENRPEIHVTQRKIYPACLPRIDQEYSNTNLRVAGWGLTQQRVFQGQRLEVRGLQNRPNHVDVAVQFCDDPDPFPYPKGLICAASPGKNSLH